MIHKPVAALQWRAICTYDDMRDTQTDRQTPDRCFTLTSMDAASVRLELNRFNLYNKSTTNRTIGA